jgi:hypothetical protein
MFQQLKQPEQQQQQQDSVASSTAAAKAADSFQLQLQVIILCEAATSQQGYTVDVQGYPQTTHVYALCILCPPCKLGVSHTVTPCYTSSNPCCVPAATYKEGQTIEVQVLVTTNHYGRIEFRLCPADATRDEQCRKLQR